MRKQKTPSIFMKYLEYYVNTYMSEARGLSKNTINSYKTTFTLLIKYMYSVKNMKADEITFGCLDVNTLSDFIPFNASHAPLQLPENTLEKTSNRPSSVSRTTPRIVEIFWNSPSNNGAST